MRILIADDELMSRRLLQRTLERAGYEVTALENGRLAADQLCTMDGPRLALLDWVMPSWTGQGFAAKFGRGSMPMFIWCCSPPKSRRKMLSQAWNPVPMIV